MIFLVSESSTSGSIGQIGPLLVGPILPVDTANQSSSSASSASSLFESASSLFGAASAGHTAGKILFFFVHNFEIDFEFFNKLFLKNLNQVRAFHRQRQM